MFQLGYAEAIQADREREIAELIRQRRLLDQEGDQQDVDPNRDQRSDAVAPRAVR